MEIVAYALGIFAFVLGAIAALFGVVHQRDLAIWTTCGAIVLAVIGGFCWLQDREWKKDTAPDTNPRSNVSADAHERITGPRFRESVNKLRLLIGTNRVTLDRALLKQRAIQFPIWSGLPVTLRLSEYDDVLLADVVILRTPGRETIYIKDGELHGRPPDWDANWSDDAFELIDSAGSPVFQLRYKDAARSTLELSGILYIDGKFIAISGGGIIAAPTLETIKSSGFRLAPIFKYPSGRYKGVCADAK
jgi:hypothetical protein